MKEATTRAVEPIDAAQWQTIRRLCERRQGVECIYPWCMCIDASEGAELAEIETHEEKGERAT